MGTTAKQITIILLIGGVITAFTINITMSTRATKPIVEAAFDNQNSLDALQQSRIEAATVDRLIFEAREAQRSAEAELFSWQQRAELKAERRLRAELDLIELKGEQLCARVPSTYGTAATRRIVRGLLLDQLRCL